MLFYLCYNTLLNLTENHRNLHIMSNITNCAYLPVCFQFYFDGHKNARQNREIGVIVLRRFWESIRSKALHESIVISLTEQFERDLNGPECKTRGSRCIIVHIILTSYVADKPECEDMLSVKRFKTQNLSVTMTSLPNIIPEQLRMQKWGFKALQTSISRCGNWIFGFRERPSQSIYAHCTCCFAKCVSRLDL